MLINSAKVENLDIKPFVSLVSSHTPHSFLYCVPILFSFPFFEWAPILPTNWTLPFYSCCQRLLLQNPLPFLINYSFSSSQQLKQFFFRASHPIRPDISATQSPDTLQFSFIACITVYGNAQLQAYLRDIGGLVPDHCNKLNIPIKYMIWIFSFLTAYKSCVHPMPVY